MGDVIAGGFNWLSHYLSLEDVVSSILIAVLSRVFVNLRRRFLVKVPFSDPSHRQSSLLKSAPGGLLLRIAKSFYSDRFFREVLEPTIFDFRAEYFEALSAGDPWKARLVLLRGYISFFKAAGIISLLRIVKLVVKIWKVIP